MEKCSSVTHTIFNMADEAQEDLDLVASFYHSIIGKIKEEVSAGNRIEFRDFGVFSLRDCGGYEGRNPKNGKTVYISAKKKFWFNVGRNLESAINDSKEAFHLNLNGDRG